MHNTFKKLSLIKRQFALIPGLKSCHDFDIALVIGSYQQEGTPLTLKQLLLMEIASAATVRRHISRMIREDVIIKVMAPSDHRTVHFLLGEQTTEHLEKCLNKIHQTLCDTSCGGRVD